ncbi:MAG: nicotinate (nicotinamide) nucleotide adenylyltransferase [Bacteroidaceae bacterium]|nr:nicotinate (nicotinamide) nucleotide adenylyltransferase [Bacteroidaceae bacterium]
MRTGIYGGSFNPMHIGHIELGGWLLEQGYLDEMWFLVSPQNPMKRQSDLLDDDMRLHLARLSVDSYQRNHKTRVRFAKRSVRVMNIEARLPRPSYMINTLNLLQRRYPKREFILIIGADNWLTFPHWYRSEEILEYHRIIIYPRPGVELNADELPESVTLISGAPENDVSSTQIREAIRNNPDYNGEGLVPEAWKEIKEWGLYL